MSHNRWDHLPLPDRGRLRRILDRIQKTDPTLIGRGIELDLIAANDDCPLDFAQLVRFKDGDFFHDIYGIHENLNRTTLKLDNCFVPRCAKREKPWEVHPATLEDLRVGDIVDYECDYGNGLEVYSGIVSELIPARVFSVKIETLLGSYAMRKPSEVIRICNLND